VVINAEAETHDALAAVVGTNEIALARDAVKAYDAVFVVTIFRANDAVLENDALVTTPTTFDAVMNDAV
jgi:hypothetical protein